MTVTRLGGLSIKDMTTREDTTREISSRGIVIVGMNVATIEAEHLLEMDMVITHRVVINTNIHPIMHAESSCTLLPNIISSILRKDILNSSHLVSTMVEHKLFLMIIDTGLSLVLRLSTLY